MIVTATTVEAINGIRERGYFGYLKAMPTTGNAYEIVALSDSSVKATVADDGTITYAGVSQ